MARISKSEWIANLASGLPGEHLYHVTSRGTILATSWGSGSTIVLVHGIGMGRSYFGHLRDALARTHRVIAVDLPGFGDSPRPDEALTIEDLADVLADFLSTLPEPVIAVGHSMGTQVVAELGSRHPEHVLAVVLIAPTVNPDEHSLPQQAFRLVQDAIGEPLLVMATAAVLYAKTGPVWFVHKLREMMAHRIEEPVAHLGMPALFVTGERDRVCPTSWVRRLSKLAPHGEFILAPDTGHEAVITGPEPLASIIAGFVERVCLR